MITQSKYTTFTFKLQINKSRSRQIHITLQRTCIINSLQSKYIIYTTKYPGLIYLLILLLWAQMFNFTFGCRILSTHLLLFSQKERMDKIVVIQLCCRLLIITHDPTAALMCCSSPWSEAHVLSGDQFRRQLLEDSTIYFQMFPFQNKNSLCSLLDLLLAQFFKSEININLTSKRSKSWYPPSYLTCKLIGGKLFFFILKSMTISCFLHIYFKKII